MLKAVLPLTLVMSLRFLGLFCVLPVISLYAQSFHSSTFLLGLAVGGAYLTQIIFQTPLGILSDKIDRKKVVIFGLFVFMIGSTICAMAHDIITLIIGRLIQGAGAIGGIVSAQISDFVREEKRTKAMAIMGGGIFASFTIGMLLGPIVGVHFGVDWLFAITAFLSLFSIVLLWVKVPSTPKISYSFEESTQQQAWREVLKNKNLVIMNLSSFLEKTFMTFIFVLIPLLFVNDLGLKEDDLWKIYIPGAFLGILALAPASILAEKYSKARFVMSYGIVLFIGAFGLIGFGAKSHLYIFVAGIILFFIGFATLEPIMQSLTSKYAKINLRGSALSIFTTYSYLGSFVGGVLGGIAYGRVDIFYIALSVCFVCVLWLLCIWALNNPAKQKNLYLSIAQYDTNKLAQIQNQQGVIECYINHTEGVIIFKYDSDLLKTDEAIKLVETIKISPSKIHTQNPHI